MVTTMTGRSFAIDFLTMLVASIGFFFVRYAIKKEKGDKGELATIMSCEVRDITQTKQRPKK